MEEVSTKGKVVEFRREIRRLLKERIIEAVDVVLAEELTQALGRDVYESGHKTLATLVAQQGVVAA